MLTQLLLWQDERLVAPCLSLLVSQRLTAVALVLLSFPGTALLVLLLLLYLPRLMLLCWHLRGL